jgi:hypothetical protein
MTKGIAPRRSVTGPKRMTPEIGEIIELLYPVSTAKALAEVLGTTTRSVHHYAWRRKLLKRRTYRINPIGAERSYGGYVYRKTNEEPDCKKRVMMAHVDEWEKQHGRKKPAGHVVVFVDGDKLNFEKDNLYCLPKSQLLAWMRFISAPVEVHVDRLIRRIMGLKTSEDVERKLLEQLEYILDRENNVDLHRQRMVCETVNTLVGLKRLELDYLRVIEGDGKIPFLETKHTEKARLKKLPADPLLRGPAADHPWRGLESGKSN